MFTLRFPAEEIKTWAARYSYNDDASLYHEVVPFMQRERYLTKPHFLKLAHWKSTRTRRHCESNADSFIEDVTRAAFAAQNEQLRVGVLTLLRGVGWPMASVILHFGSNAPYPILDYRALWSLGVDMPSIYSFPFWWEYTNYTRLMAADVGVTMRELDRALWQFSKENQGTTSL
jgi:hypothetical protein